MEKKQAFVPPSMGKPFDKAFVEALEKPLITLSPIHMRSWLEAYAISVRPCLEKLFEKHSVSPHPVLALGAAYKSCPAPQEYPAKLRNRRKRESTAALFEKAAAAVSQLKLVNGPPYSLGLLSDLSVDSGLRDVAKRVRELQSIPGRPEDRLLNDYAVDLANLFSEVAGTPLYPYIATLVEKTFPERWAAHGDDTDSITKLIERHAPTSWGLGRVVRVLVNAKIEFSG